MTMTAREAMQAVLAGKTVMMESAGGSRTLVKLGEDDMLICRTDNETEFHEPDYVGFNHAEDVYEEYTLTFEQALRAMLDGKVVKCEFLIDSRRFHDSEFQFMNSRGEWIQVNWFENELQKGKWKVVE